MDSLLEEIKLFFASTFRGAQGLSSLPPEYPAWAIRHGSDFGVAVKWDRDTPLSEHFSNAHLHSEHISILDYNGPALLLTMDHEDLRNEFASVCEQFLNPGKDGSHRKAILENPLDWWTNWKELMGNAIHDKAPYSVMCEMMALRYIRTFDPAAEWTAAKSGTHDIESENHSYEVKSTVKRYDSSVTISGQFQLLTPKPLDLYFFRVEESPVGFSINDMRDLLVNDGYSSSQLESELKKAGYEIGASARDRKYAILEKLVYPVDDEFPKITASSFKGDVIPDGISHIQYDVDLKNLKHTSW